MCTTGCKTQDHASYGECLKAKNLRTLGCDMSSGKDYTSYKKWHSRLQEYRDAKRQGIQPSGTSLEKIRRAVEISNRTGVAFRADRKTPPPVLE